MLADTMCRYVHPRWVVVISGCLTCVGYVVSSQASLLSVFAPFLIFCSGMYTFEVVSTLCYSQSTQCLLTWLTFIKMNTMRSSMKTSYLILHKLCGVSTCDILGIGLLYRVFQKKRTLIAPSIWSLLFMHVVCIAIQRYSKHDLNRLWNYRVTCMVNLTIFELFVLWHGYHSTATILSRFLSL